MYFSRYGATKPRKATDSIIANINKEITLLTFSTSMIIVMISIMKRTIYKRKVLTVKKSNFINFSIILSLILAVILTLCPISEVSAENLDPESKNLNALLNETLDEQLDQLYNEPLNFTGKLSFDTGTSTFPGLDAEFQDMLKNLLLEISCQLSPQDNAQQISLQMYNKDYPEQALKFHTYNVEEKLLIDLPAILEKPLVLDLSKIIEQLFSDPEFQDQVEVYEQIQSLFESGKINEELISSAVEDFLNALQNAAEYFQDQGEVDEYFMLEGVREKLTVSSKVLSGKNFIAAYQEFLGEISKSEFIANIYDLIYGLANDPYMPETFIEALEPAIQEANDLSEKNISEQDGMGILEYKDLEGNIRGYTFRLYNSDTNLLFLETYYLEDESKLRGIRRPIIASFELNDARGMRQAEARLLMDYSESETEKLAPLTLIIKPYSEYGEYVESIFMLDYAEREDEVSARGSLTSKSSRFDSNEHPSKLLFNYSSKDKTKQLEASLFNPDYIYANEAYDLRLQINEEKEGVYSGSFGLEHRDIESEEIRKILDGNFTNCEYIEVLPGITSLFGKLELKIITTNYVYEDSPQATEGRESSEKILNSEENSDSDKTSKTESDIIYPQKTGSFDVTTVFTLESLYKGAGEFSTSIQILPDKTVQDEYLKFTFDGKVSTDLNPEIPESLPKNYVEISSPEDIDEVFENPQIEENLQRIGSYIVGQAAEK